MKFNDFLKEELKNDEFREEYEKLSPEYDIISAMIKGRNEKGLTQKDLAKIIGTDQARISRLESGNLNPSLEFLKRVANGLGKELKISFIEKKK